MIIPVPENLQNIELRIIYGDDFSDLETFSIRCIDIMIPDRPTVSPYLRAYIHEISDYRNLRMKKILRAEKLETAEKIRNVFAYFNLPDFSPKPKRYPIDVGKVYPDQYIQSARSEQKRNFWRKFRGVRIIEEHFREQFFQLFDDKCFKCGKRNGPPFQGDGRHRLVIDHHIPIVLGGELVPGNMVALCRRCNGIKHDMAPELFYTADELHALEALLEQEYDIFDFIFDQKLWAADRESYLRFLNIRDEWIIAALTDPKHPLYLEPPEPGISMTLGLDGIVRPKE